MPKNCKTCPLRDREIFADVSADQLTAIERFKSGELRVDAGTSILMEGTSSPQLFTALDGMGLRYKTLEDGSRQVVNLIFPGDFIGLQASMMGSMQHSVESTTAMTLCVFDRAAFLDFFRSNPTLAFNVTWLAAVEEHFLGEALTSLGQRSALERMAWALMRIYLRADAVGLAKRNACPLPYRQQDIADSLGLSLVHTNKTLAKLRDRQLASWHDGELVIHNIEALADLAMVDLSKPVTRPLI